MKKPILPRWTRFLPCLGLLLLAGCNMTLLDPKGQVGVDIKNIILIATWLMLLVVVPVIVLTLVFAWKYRASNTKARYEPDWSHSTAIEVVVWLIPCLIITAGVPLFVSSWAPLPYPHWLTADGRKEDAGHQHPKKLRLSDHPAPPAGAEPERRP